MSEQESAGVSLQAWEPPRMKVLARGLSEMLIDLAEHHDRNAEQWRAAIERLHSRIDEYETALDKVHQNGQRTRELNDRLKMIVRALIVTGEQAVNPTNVPRAEGVSLTGWEAAMKEGIHMLGGGGLDPNTLASLRAAYERDQKQDEQCDE